MKETTLKQKADHLASIDANLKAASSIIIVEYRGLKVAQLEELRRLLAKETASLRVLKNTMFTRAAQTHGINFDAPLEGPNAFIFTGEDITAAPKILTKFARTHAALVIKGGVIEGVNYDRDQVIRLASMPNRSGLLSMFVGCLNEPIRKFASVLQAITEKAA